MLNEEEKDQIANRTAEAIISKVTKIILIVGAVYLILSNLGIIIVWGLILLSLPAYLLPKIGYDMKDAFGNFDFWTSLFGGYGVIIGSFALLKGIGKVQERNNLYNALNEEEKKAFIRLDSQEDVESFLKMTSEERLIKYTKFFKEELKPKVVIKTDTIEKKHHEAGYWTSYKKNKSSYWIFIIIPILITSVVVVVLLTTRNSQVNNKEETSITTSKCDTENGWEDGFGKCHCNAFFEIDSISNKCIKQRMSAATNTQVKAQPVKCNENETNIDGQCICTVGFIFDAKTNKCVKDAFLNVTSHDAYSTATTSIPKPISVSGFTSDNCSEITIFAVNDEAQIKDEYTLSDYKKGNESFTYKINDHWKNEKPNLGFGENTYTFKASCDNKVVEDTIIINYTSNLPSHTYDNYSPLPSTYISPSYSPNYGGNTFYDYPCTDDCSGHDAGYEWAEEEGIDNVDDCGGNSNSFIEGCEAYVEENY